MINRILSVTALLALFALAAAAQPPTAAKEDKFKVLLTKLKAGDTKIDFKELRMTSVDSQEKDAGVEADEEGYKKAVAAFRDNKLDVAIKEADKALSTGYLDSKTHLLLAVAYERSGNKPKFEFHKGIYLGLINSILSGGDGQSAKTAFVVIHVDEEYAVLQALELRRGSQGLRNQDGHKFDVLTVTDPKTGKTTDLWFNIDIVWKGYEKIFK